MVVPAGGAWLALHVLLLAVKPTLVSMAVTSPSSLASSWSGHVSHNVTAYDDHYNFSSGQQQQQQQQADMPVAEPYYNAQGMESGQAGADSMLADGDSLLQDSFHIEDIQVGCRELRAKRYISDGFCTSTKPIKEVVCAGNCLPIRNLPWYAEFVKVWAKSKLREWQCEEDIVRRKTVSLLCRNGDYRTYRIKVVKSCKCKRMVSKHNRTVSGEGKKKKNKKKRKKDRRRRGRKNRRGGEKKNKKDAKEKEEKEKEQEEEEEEEIDVSQSDQRQEGSRQGKERKGRKRKRLGEQEDRNSQPGEGKAAAPEGSVSSADSDSDSARHKALAEPTR